MAMTDTLAFDFGVWKLSSCAFDRWDLIFNRIVSLNYNELVMVTFNRTIYPSNLSLFLQVAI